MKIQIASDLHLELRPDWLPTITEFRSVPDRDVLILAGDIGTFMKAMVFIEREVEISPVIYVPGNHEYYSWQMRDQIDLAWRQAAKLMENLHYLVAETETINGIRIWAGPWYSDLFGRREPDYLKLMEQSINDFDFEFSGAGTWTIHHHLGACAVEICDNRDGMFMEV